MRGPTLALAFLLIGAAPAEVPVGTFQTWYADKKAPVDFVSGGVRVHVAALPCPARPGAESPCGTDDFNNQATVTVSGPDMPPLSVTTDRQSEYARIAVVRFARNDPRPGVIVESQYGGSGGALTAQVLIPGAAGYHAVAVARDDGAYLEGQLADFPADLSGDGSIDLEFEDGAFDTAFGCNACTPRPPMLFAVKNGKIVNESRDPALRGVFAADMARLAPKCLSDTPDRNGACAAYVADAARAGQFRAAWAGMVKQYERDKEWWQPCSVPVSAWTNHRRPEQCRKSFPDALRAFLTKAGYLPG